MSEKSNADRANDGKVRPVIHDVIMHALKLGRKELVCEAAIAAGDGKTVS